MKKLTSLGILTFALLGLMAGCAAKDPVDEGDSAAAKEANSKPVQPSTTNGVEKPALNAPSGKLDEGK